MVNCVLEGAWKYFPEGSRPGRPSDCPICVAEKPATSFAWHSAQGCAPQAGHATIIAANAAGRRAIRELKRDPMVGASILVHPAGGIQSVNLRAPKRGNDF